MTESLPLDTVPPLLNRFFAPDPRIDAHGFLDRTRTAGLVEFNHLLEHPNSLISAPPWAGKTYFSKAAETWVRQDEVCKSRFGSFVGLTRFEDYDGPLDVPPRLWWENWVSLTPAPEALWIVDALDEADPKIPGSLLHAIGKLDDAHRRSLRLIIFTRPRDWLPKFGRDVEQLHLGVPMSQLQMAPLDPNQAEIFVGREHFDRIVGLIENCGLASIAGYPRVLYYLKQLPSGAKPDVADVWRGILVGLVQDPQRRREEELLKRSEPEKRFEVCARLAVALSLCGQREVFHDATLIEAVTVARVFPPETTDNLARAALRDALHLDLFRNTPSGAYRFAQQNLQDWMCAFGLARVGVTQLRTALGDGEKPFPRHRDMLTLLMRVSEVADVRAWLSVVLNPLVAADIQPWDLNESLEWLDKLETIARKSPWDLGIYRDALARLATPGLGPQLALRLSAKTIEPKVGELLLDVAKAVGATEALPPAIRIVLDASEDDALRLSAAIFVAKVGASEDLRVLERPIATSPATTEMARRIKALVIYALFEQKSWSLVKAVRHAPAPSRSVGDARAMLVDTLKRSMTPDDGRDVVFHLLRRVSKRSRRLARVAIRVPHHLDELLRTGLALVLGERQSRDFQRHLAHAFIRVRNIPWGRHLLLDLVGSLAQFSTFRRSFYRRAVSQSVATKIPNQHPRPHGLRHDDLLWLFRLAESRWRANEAVWADVYSLLPEKVEEAVDGIPSRSKLLHRMEVACPGLAGKMEAASREYAEYCKRFERSPRPSKKAEKRYTIVEAVEQLLMDQRLSGGDRMRRLSQLCFATRTLGFENVDGDFASLVETMQARVLGACKDGLESGEPTPISDDSSFSSDLICESLAFQTIVEAPQYAGWLTSEWITRWLPAVIRTTLDQSLNAVRVCAAAAPTATAGVFTDAIERDLRVGSQFAFVADRMPVELWTAEFSERAVILVSESRFTPSARAALLAVLSRRIPAAAKGLAKAWADPHGDDAFVDPLRQQSLNCLLSLDADAAWPLVETDYRARAKEALLGLPSLWGEGDGLHVSLATWPSTRLGALCRMLIESFPRAADPKRLHSYAVTPDVALRELRSSVVRLLLERNAPGDEDAFLVIAELDPYLKDMHLAHQARHEASRLVEELPLSSVRDEQQLGVPLGKAVQLLDDEDFRVIRSNSDLQSVLLELLGRIARDVGYDLKLLYGSPILPKRSGSRIKGRKVALPKREHLREEAIQAYLRRRFKDLLPRFLGPGATAEYLCEDQVRYRRRLDLRVVAPMIGGKGLATVVIEIKWSDNPETETSLVDQLGEHYLVGEGLTHGIYLVGWCGWWKQKRKRRSRDRKSLSDFLKHQADEVRTKRSNNGLHIAPLVLGLEWREEPAV